MKIEGKNVTGIKAAVGYLCDTPADRWAITLDMSDWSVMGRELLGQDYLVCHFPTVQILCGHGNDGWGRENPTMAQVKDAVANVIRVRAKAREDFKRGCYHPNLGYDSAEDEGWENFCLIEFQAAGI